MGMFNEAWKRCPECGDRACAQIHEIVGGFGDFDMDDPSYLEEQLSPTKLFELHAALAQEPFRCDCGNVFILRAKVIYE